MHLILFFLFSFTLTAKTNLYDSPKWLKLLHYKKNLVGHFVSEADSPSFFLHKNGKRDPQSELEASIKIFAETTSPDDGHPICRFPLRYKWLNHQLGMPWKADFSGCKKYIGFFSKLAARRASIIFSSYYLANPNTAFGHTLLRLSRFDDKSETEMLDYGINYAVKAKETNPFLYAIKGLFGGFIGEFAAVPYYYKIREYSNFEFRDLWSYDLRLSTPEVLEMVDHIWELGQTHFDYFYFKENCSYHLLSIIDVARPALNLTDEYSVFTVPADTVRLLHQKGLIDEGKRRESTYSRLVRMSEDLNKDELETSRKIAKHPEQSHALIEVMENKAAAKVLDVAMEAFDYLNFEKILKDDPKTNEIKAPLLRERAINPVITNVDENQKTVRLDSPALGHSPTRLSLAENYFDQQGKATRFEFRAALHDLLDPPAGSLKDAQLELARLSVEVKENQYHSAQIVLDHLSLFNIRNFPEQNFWSSPLSWEIDVGAKQLRRECFNCPAGFLNASLGNSFGFSERKFLLAVLVNGEMNIQSQFINNYRFGVGPKIYGRMKFSDRWLLGMQSYYHFNTYEHDKFFQDHEWWNELELRHHLTGKVSLSLKGGGIERDRIWMPFGELGLQYFYQ